VKIAQEQLWHASIATTLNNYTHVVDASHRQAIEALERQLFPTVPSRRKRRVRQSLKVKTQTRLGKRLRPQASAGGKS
jgi:hypothetical protein